MVLKRCRQPDRAGAGSPRRTQPRHQGPGGVSVALKLLKMRGSRFRGQDRVVARRLDRVAETELAQERLTGSRRFVRSEASPESRLRTEKSGLNSRLTFR